MTRRAEAKPATVPFGATPAGEPPSVKEWANRSVWTDRMLDALLTGVRGGKWHTHQRWPNAYFAERGLFCLGAAQVRLNQSLTGP